MTRSQGSKRLPPRPDLWQDVQAIRPPITQRLAAAALGWRARRRLASSPKRSSLDPKIGWNEGMKRAKIAKVKFSWSFPLSQQKERSTASA
jgi:hypothetical protein